MRAAKEVINSGVLKRYGRLLVDRHAAHRVKRLRARGWYVGGVVDPVHLLVPVFVDLAFSLAH